MTATAPIVELNPGDELHGFTVEAVTVLPEIRCTAIRASHARSGARVLHLAAHDKENLLALAFRTPPPDDTGLPHILEHTVLCGSKTYPVKDPFVELLKTSLATFLNAMTYPDKTVYPCASMNKNDFFNLAGVYCDAVFHPLITEKHFKQEGHHFEFAEPGNTDSALTLKGIVYNEMKGAYSDLDGTIDRELCKSICPDNAYGRDSGGDPERIPDLTYEQFVEFHRKYYHPSNALIFLYGDIPTQEHFQFLDTKYLSAFDAIDIDTTIDEQPRWVDPIRRTQPYPLGANEDEAGKAAVALTWLAGDVTDPVESLSMSLLEYYLIGNAASPLRKALIDSQLGEELTDSGYANYQRDTFFTVGLKGTEPDRAQAIEDLVFTTVGGIVEAGLDKEKIEAAFHRLEIASREIGGRYPLQLMDRVYRSWLYDADPLHLLQLGKHLSALRQRYEQEERFFEKQLQQYILDNRHYSALTFIPDKGLAARKAADFAERMNKVKETLSTEKRRQIDTEAAELQAMQNAPNPPEALATLPRLTREDVSPEPVELPTVTKDVAGRPFLHTDTFAGGISYLRIAIDLSGLDDELVDYVALYTQALSKMGAGGADYSVMAEREAACTGGIHASASAGGHVDNPHRVHPQFVVTFKALDSRLDEALGVLEDRLLRCDLNDHDRLADIVRQTRVQMKSHLVPSGNRYAQAYAERHLSRNASLNERLSGITQIRFVESIAADLENNRQPLADKLAAVRDFLHARNRVTLSFVGPQNSGRIVSERINRMLGEMREEAVPMESSDWTPDTAREGIATPADVAFVARAMPAVDIQNPAAPALLLLSMQLSYGYLWNEIRVKGGAYGAHARYSPLDAQWCFSSYRDPFVAQTLSAYDRALDYIVNDMDLSAPALEQAIIGTVKTLDQPIRPGMAVSKALALHLSGSTPELRKSFRERLLSLTADDVRSAAERVLRPGMEASPVCVVSSREKLEEANPLLGNEPLEICDL